MSIDNQIEPLTAIAISTITFLVGLIAGNWLAIGRDRRKEFNAAIGPLRAMLLKERDIPSPVSPRPDAEALFTPTRMRLWK